MSRQPGPAPLSPTRVPAEGDVTRPRQIPRTSRWTRFKRHRREYLLFLVLLSPNLILVGTFEYWPVIYNAYLSFTDWDFLAAAPEFVGLENYQEMFTDPDFRKVLLNTLFFTGAVVIGSVVIGLALALLFNQRLRGRAIVRTVAFAPHIVSGAAVAMLWLFIFDPSYGLMRVLLDPVGIDSPNWVNDNTWALPALVIAYVWARMGFIAIIYVAGLQSLPTELYEAAKIDGAGTWTLFRRITLPLLSPVTFFVVVISIIGVSQAFDLIAVLTGGGPGIASTTLSWYIYEEGFKASDAGRAAASSVLLFLILLTVTAIQTRFMQRRVHYR